MEQSGPLFRRTPVILNEGRTPVQAKAEKGVRLLQDKECQRLTAGRRKLGERHGTSLSLRSQTESTCQYLDCGLRASRTASQHNSVA